jgi:hypothetical protein
MSIDSDVSGALASVMAGNFQIVLHRSPDLLVSSTINPREYTDTFKLLDTVLKLLRNGSVQERLIGNSLTFIKQHYNLFRHAPQKVSLLNIFKVVEKFNDLIQAFIGVSESFPEKKFLLQRFVTFATQYWVICCKAGIEVPPLLMVDQREINSFSPSPSPPPISPSPLPPLLSETPLSPPLSPPSLPSENSPSGFVPFHPQPSEELLYPHNHKSLKWYKTNGWKDFITQKVIRIEKGKYKGKLCRVKKWDGNTVRCLFPDDEIRCVSVNNVVSYA